MTELAGPIGLCCSTRLAVAILILISACIQYSQKIDLSVNIICMVANESTGLAWDKNIQGLLLSSFFWGFLLSQILSGILASKFGPKWFMVGSMTVSGFAIILYPSAAVSSYKTFMILRFVVGFCAGVLFPCITQIWSKWGPILDKSTLVSVSVSGAHLGSVVTLPLGGYLCSRFGNKGWPILFYVIGIASLLWVMAWTFYFSNSPRQHRFISDEEKMFIIKNTPAKRREKTKHKIPWRKIWTSSACWAQFITHMCMSWGFYTLLTCMPMYMAEVLKFKMKTNGFLSAIPFLSVWITTTSSGRLADVLIRGNYVSKTRLRKSANLVGSIVPACCLLAICAMDASKAFLAVILLTLATSFFGIAFGAGYLCVCNDLSSRFAGVLFGISNTFATIPGILTPYVTAVITSNKTGWTVVFVLSAVIWVIAGVGFALFGSAENQFENEPNLGNEEETTENVQIDQTEI